MNSIYTNEEITKNSEHIRYEAGNKVSEISGECMYEEQSIKDMLQKIDKYLENESKFDIKLYDADNKRSKIPFLQLQAIRINEKTVLNYDKICNYIMSLKHTTTI